MNDLTVKLQKTIKAPIEKVFNAWLDAPTLAKFMMPMSGMPEPKTEVDPRVGGRFAIHMQVGDDVIPHQGEYLEIDAPNKIVFTWESPFSTDGSTVSILLNATDANTTQIDFTHVKFLNEEARSNHEGGWGLILELLENVTSPAGAAA